MIRWSVKRAKPGMLDYMCASTSTDVPRDGVWLRRLGEPCPAVPEPRARLRDLSIWILASAETVGLRWEETAGRRQRRSG